LDADDMATATGKPTLPTAISGDITHPLDQLRGTIRRYVVIEGLLSAGLFVAAWLVLGLLLDFGLFKAATWDWVIDGPWWLRAAALGVSVLLLVGILVLQIARRLSKELSYPALALVLERRFPKTLGDRLITAVELADVPRAARYGFSAEMIVQTIAEARERVAKVPVAEVFNWRRLAAMAKVLGGILLGALLVGYVAYGIGAKTLNPYKYGWRAAHVVGIFLERDVLLWDTPWPRRAHLELVGFPDEGLKIAKDAPAPRVAARAFKWVVADRSAPMGWRPMAWSDVTEGLLGGSVPYMAPSLSGATLDHLETVAFRNSAARSQLRDEVKGERFVEIQNGLERVFDVLNGHAENPRMARTLRRLEIPENVRLTYSGPRTAGSATLAPGRDNEFAGEVAGLKERVRFTVRAEDYRTPLRVIDVVSPPMLTKLVRTEYQPAYLYHSPPQLPAGETPERPYLAGKHQRLADKALSLTGERSVVTVPAGTELVLTGTTDKDLLDVVVRPKIGLVPGAKPGSAEPVSLVHTSWWFRLLARPKTADDGRTFAVAFRGPHRLTGSLEFELEFTDTDKVKSRRAVLVQVTEDQPPTVEVAVDGIRKVESLVEGRRTGQFLYYVTPQARIPFNPESVIRDDHGLGKVEFVYTYWAEASSLEAAFQGRAVARLFLDAPALPGPQALALPAVHAGMFVGLSSKPLTASAAVGRFFEMQRDLPTLTRDALANQLGEPFPEGQQTLVKKVELNRPNADVFDVASAFSDPATNENKLLARAGDVQTRYRIDLNVVATDTNLESGPKTGKNQEVIRLLVVSEADLLSQIGVEETALAGVIKEAQEKVGAARTKIEFVRNRNGVGDARDDATMAPVKVRATDALQDVAKARDRVQGVLRDYRRIYRECQINRVSAPATSGYGRLGNRFERVLGENPAPVDEEEARDVGSGALRPLSTFARVEKLLGDVVGALSEGRWADPATASDAEIEINKLFAELEKLRSLLGDRLELEKLTNQLSNIIERQEQVRRDIEKRRDQGEKDRLSPFPTLGAAGPIFLTKGESKRVRHSIAWNQYKEDDLTVKVAASDPAGVIVPAELKLSFESNNLDFEYEIRAGQKEGEFTLTLTPQAGKPVKVQVTVK
jgi:hypothetical protein